MVTASQLNRSAVEEIEFDHSHISGGISKINTADNVFGIFTSRAMRERGRYQIQLMKTRSSSGVGSKVDLEFDINTLRISDCEQSEDSAIPGTGGFSMNNIKPVSKTSNIVSKEVPNVQADVQGSQLKNMLNNLKGL